MIKMTLVVMRKKILILNRKMKRMMMTTMKREKTKRMTFKIKIKW